MNIKKIYRVILIFFPSLIFPQQKIDSLEILLEKSSGLKKTKIIEQLIEEYMTISPVKSISLAKEGLSLSEEFSLTEERINFLSNLGLAYRLIGSYNQSLEYYLKILVIAEEKNDSLKLSQVKNDIGNVYNYLGNLDKALKYYKESLQIREKQKDTLNIAKSLNNIGNIYKNFGKLDTALAVLSQALEYKKLMNDKEGTATTLKNIGNVYFSMNNPDSAFKYFGLALNIEENRGDSIGIANSFIMLAKTYFDINNFEKAESFANKALEISERTEVKHFLLSCYRLLYNIKAKLGNYKDALYYNEKYLEVRDNIYADDINKQALEIEAIHNLSQKEKQVHELELNKKTLQNNIFVIIAIVALASVAGFIFYYKDKIKSSNQIKEKNKELNAAIERSEKANQMKSDFLAQMSHEIRTPINTIVNYTSLLRTEFEENLPEDLIGSFDSIENAATRLLRTIDLVLNMSDIESGTYEAIYQQMKIYEEIIEPIYIEFYNSVKAKGLELKIINELSEDPSVKVDGYTMSQIMANLVDNAIKYTAAGTIELKLHSVNNNPAISISDTGIGISEKYIPQLFTKFSQEEQGYTRKFEGTGLGLSLVKKYCEINNCDISVKSKKGEGTIFTLLFN